MVVLCLFRQKSGTSAETLDIPCRIGYDRAKENIFNAAQRGPQDHSANARPGLAAWVAGLFLFLCKGGSNLTVKAQLMDEAAMRRALMRISHEITEKNRGTEDLVLVGILRRGADLAQIISDNIEKIEGVRVPCERIDIHNFRDDLTHIADAADENPRIDVTEKKVVLVDDVLYTGRSVRAAIEAIFSMGRPSAIQLAILVDRGHRELPIRADFVGKNVPTSHTEKIAVMTERYDGCNAVMLTE